MSQLSLEEWVDELLNGGHDQAESFLQIPDEDKMCCLGVLCYRSGMEFIETVDYDVDDYDIAIEDVRHGFGFQDQILFGNESTDGIFMEILNDDALHSLNERGISENYLASLNDNGASFEEISEVILYGRWIPTRGELIIEKDNLETLKEGFG